MKHIKLFKFIFLLVFKIFFIYHLTAQSEVKYFIEKITIEDSLYFRISEKCFPFYEKNSNFTFYFCNFNNTIPTEFVQDSVSIVIEAILNFHFDDSLEYFTIREIKKFFPSYSIFTKNKNNEDEEIKRIFLKEFDKTYFYYSKYFENKPYFVGNFNSYINIRLVLIPK
jgi:hypothetical protein